jgi:hypothetical protein
MPAGGGRALLSAVDILSTLGRSIGGHDAVDCDHGLGAPDALDCSSIT